MNGLLRELAPLAPQAWSLIEDEASRTLKGKLAARKLVDFAGPLGWEASSINEGRVARVEEPLIPGVEARLRKVRPLVELRVPFELSRDELEAAGRGAKDPDLEPVRKAADTAATAEDRAVFRGFAAAGIRGIADEAAAAKLILSEDYTAYPGVVAEAIGKLHGAGIAGRYAIALGPRCYTGLSKTTVGGYPVMEHVRRLLDGPIIWAPAVDGAVVMSLRGGDFELIVGQDFSVGYLEHSASAVRLYIQESFTFRVLEPRAAVPLVYASAARK
jgi:uncharacterized linocin/CFP29 family protein